jgi:hypothetical protein
MVTMSLLIIMAIVAYCSLSRSVNKHFQSLEMSPSLPLSGLTISHASSFASADDLPPSQTNKVVAEPATAEPEPRLLIAVDQKTPLPLQSSTGNARQKDNVNDKQLLNKDDDNNANKKSPFPFPNSSASTKPTSSKRSSSAHNARTGHKKSDSIPQQQAPSTNHSERKLVTFTKLKRTLREIAVVLVVCIICIVLASGYDLFSFLQLHTQGKLGDPFIINTTSRDLSVISHYLVWIPFGLFAWYSWTSAPDTRVVPALKKLKPSYKLRPRSPAATLYPKDRQLAPRPFSPRIWHSNQAALLRVLFFSPTTTTTILIITSAKLI